MVVEQSGALRNSMGGSRFKFRTRKYFLTLEKYFDFGKYYRSRVAKWLRGRDQNYFTSNEWQGL